MSYIDALIPFAAGLVILLFPQRFVRPSNDAALKAKYEKRLRIAGYTLLGVAVLYALMTFFSPPHP